MLGVFSPAALAPAPVRELPKAAVAQFTCLHLGQHIITFPVTEEEEPSKLEDAPTLEPSTQGEPEPPVNLQEEEAAERALSKPEDTEHHLPVGIDGDPSCHPILSKGHLS